MKSDSMHPMKFLVIGLIAVIVCQNPTARNVVADGLDSAASVIRYGI